jgi:hypothetical protein
MSAGPAVVFKTRDNAAAPPAPVDAPEPPGSAVATFATVRALATAVREEISEPLSKYLDEIFGKLAKFEKLKLALSKVQTQLAQVAGENEALKLIVEHARAASRGEPGVSGPRGTPGGVVAQS